MDTVVGATGAATTTAGWVVPGSAVDAGTGVGDASVTFATVLVALSRVVLASWVAAVVLSTAAVMGGVVATGTAVN